MRGASKRDISKTSVRNVVAANTTVAFSQLGIRLEEYKVEYEEALSCKLVALEGRRRVLGEEHKSTLDSLQNLALLLEKMEDYEGSLAYYQQALTGKERVLGKTHPSTLMTLINLAGALVGLKSFQKAEELYKQALERYEKSHGKDHKGTKKCARNLGILYAKVRRAETSMQQRVAPRSLVSNRTRLASFVSLSQITKSKEKTRELAKAFPHLLTETGCVPRMLNS